MAREGALIRVCMHTLKKLSNKYMVPKFKRLNHKGSLMRVVVQELDVALVVCPCFQLFC
jgi:hypothetical protein